MEMFSLLRLLRAYTIALIKSCDFVHQMMGLDRYYEVRPICIRIPQLFKLINDNAF